VHQILALSDVAYSQKFRRSRIERENLKSPLRLSVAGVAAKGNVFFPYPFHCFLDERVEPLAALLQMIDDFLSHARRPEFGEVIGNAGDSRFVLLGCEEFADLISHIDEFFGRSSVMRHCGGPGQ